MRAAEYIKDIKVPSTLFHQIGYYSHHCTGVSGRDQEIFKLGYSSEILTGESWVFCLPSSFFGFAKKPRLYFLSWLHDTTRLTGVIKSFALG